MPVRDGHIHNLATVAMCPGAADKWGGWFLLAMFGAILTWEEVWDLPNSAALSAWLLLLITAGAMICSWWAHTYLLASLCKLRRLTAVPMVDAVVAVVLKTARLLVAEMQSGVLRLAAC